MEKDVSSRIERLHLNLLSDGDTPYSSQLILNSGIINNPRITKGNIKVKSWYAIVNGLKTIFPVKVDAGDALTIVAVMKEQSVS